MAFQALKNFTRTLTSLVNHNQRKLRVVSIATNGTETAPQKGTLENPIPVLVQVIVNKR